MKTLILPVAGLSSRFPGMRPKWLLTMPDGKLMIEKSVSLIDLDTFDKIVVVCVREHLESFLGADASVTIKSFFPQQNVECCVLDNTTSSQSETVALAIDKLGINGAIFIKDCDNQFSFVWNGGNQVATISLDNVDLIDAKNKSYVETDAFLRITNIVEKKVISNRFCVGGYGFSCARQYMDYFNKVNDGSEIYISHVIFSMLLDRQIFESADASNYVDWGTLREYRHYCKNYLTVFCDIDGVLLENGSKFGPHKWSTDAIIANVSVLSKLKKSGLLYLILTSSRPESEIVYVRDILDKLGLKPDRFIMGLPHSRRFLINDYSTTNPYPSAIAINLERNSDNLESFLLDQTGSLPSNAR